MALSSGTIAALLGGILACGSPSALAQTVAAASQNQATASLGDTLRRTSGNEQLHIFYVHGIASDGPGDYDSWSLRKAICDFVKDCVAPAGELVGRDYADQDEFKLDTPPPALNYLGKPVWNSNEEWNAAAPYVIHWKLSRKPPLQSDPAIMVQAIYVDEINWWPLVFSLKCRQIVASDAVLVGPSADRIRLCSTKKADSGAPGRFVSYDWISATDAPRLLALSSRGALVNRKLKNGLLDWGFSDAVLALGPLRTYLLDGIRQLILKSVAMDTDSGLGRAGATTASQEYVIVSHSLGSYLIFAALDINRAAPQSPAVQDSGDAFEHILARTSLVYFFANQLRLLELAALDGTQDKNLVTHLESWGKLRCNYLQSQPGVIGKCANPQIVALNDPSDLLTWTVPELASVDVRNVTVKNSRHWFWLFESPTKAHDDYAKNKSAIGQMLKSKQ